MMKETIKRIPYEGKSKKPLKIITVRGNDVGKTYTYPNYEITEEPFEEEVKRKKSKKSTKVKRKSCKCNK